MPRRSASSRSRQAGKLVAGREPLAAGGGIGEAVGQLGVDLADGRRDPLGAPPGHVDRGVARDGRHPGDRRGDRRIEIAGAAPDPDIGFLHCILRSSFTAQDTADTGVEFRAGALEEGGEGRAVAGGDRAISETSSSCVPPLTAHPPDARTCPECDPVTRDSRLPSPLVATDIARRQWLSVQCAARAAER